VIAALLLAALALDLALALVAASPIGFSRAVGPFRIRLHVPTTLLIIAALLSGAAVGWCWTTRARGRALLAAVAAVALGAIVLARGAGPIFPVGDIALVELYVRNALAGHLLVGAYSRFGWHHPGPLYFYLLAPAYASTGGVDASLAAGSAVVAFAAVATAMWAAGRAMGPRASAAVGAMLLLYVWRVPELTASAWNPHVIVLPVFTLVLVCNASAAGDLIMIPVIVAVASFLAQTDAALVPTAAVVGLGGIASAVLQTPTAKRARASAALNAAAWIAAALWLLPITEQLTHEPGNMTLLWRFFIAHGTGQTLAHASAAWAGSLDGMLLPSLTLATGGTFETNHVVLSIALAIAQLCALSGVAVAVRRRAADLSRLAAFAIAASLVALWSATRIEGRIMDHEVFWISALGAVNLAVFIAAFVVLVVPRSDLDARYGAAIQGLVIAGVAAICFAQAERGRAGRLPVTPTNPAVQRLALSMREYVDRSGHKPLIRLSDATWSLAAGVLLQADRLGVPFAVEPAWMPMFPESFAATGEEDVEVEFGDSDEHLERINSGATPIDSFSNVFLDGKKR
jgi:hypothetical protein